MKFACVGDIHGFWEDSDTEYFNASDYDFLLLTGDLPDHKPFPNRRQNLYQKLNALRIPTYMALGNWDGANLLQLIGEVFQNKAFIHLGSLGHIRRIRKLKQNLSNIQIGSYSLIPLSDENPTSKKRNDPNSNLGDFSHANERSRFNRIGLLIGRPFTCGGPNLGFQPSLKRIYRITSMEDSVESYKKLIDSCKEDFHSLIFLTHNGPTGLGDKATDIYGCDFRREEGDWGDPDLEVAIRYAKSNGIQIPLVVSGHMHHQNPKTKSLRKWLLEKDGTTYLNAAKVPRTGSYYSVELVEKEGMGTRKVVVKEIYIDRSI